MAQLLPRVLRVSRVPAAELLGSARAAVTTNRHSSSSTRTHILEAGPAQFLRDAEDPSRAHVTHLCDDVPLLTQTTGQMLQRSAEAFPDRLAVVSVYQNQRITFQELLRKADYLGAGLRALGLQSGDRVALWGPNSAEWVIAKMATNRAGLTLVTLNYAYQSRELVHCLRKVSAKALICNHTFKTHNYPQIVMDVAPEITTCTPGDIKCESLPDLKALITITDEVLPGSLRLSEAMAAATGEQVREICNLQDSISCHDVSEIQFTSGTTGDPKAVVLTHHNIVNEAHFINLLMKSNIYTERFVKGSLVPFFHVFGGVDGVTSCVVGGDTLVIPCAHYSPADFLRAIQAEKCDFLIGAPTMFIDLLVELEKNGGKGFESVREILSGGAYATPELFEKLKQSGGHIKIRQGYGMTESSGATFLTPRDSGCDRVQHYVGQLFPKLEAKVVDAAGNTVRFGEPGELLVRGYLNSKGYWQDEQKTKQAFTEDGWLKTGDQFILEENGYARVVGRIKDIVIRGGENIAPKEVEDALAEHPEVLEATVFGVPDDRLGEELAAAVRLKRPDHCISPEDVRSFLKGKIAHFKIPKYVEFMEDFPKTQSGKVQKYKLQELFSRKPQVSVPV